MKQMKKFMAGIISLIMVFAVAITVSAAPNVSGKVEIEVDNERQSNLKTEVDFSGQLNESLDYNFELQGDTVGTTNPVIVDEASLTYTNELGQIQFGRFSYNTSVMDIMDTANVRTMKDNAAIKASTNIGENMYAAIGYQIAEGNGFAEGAYQAEFDYSLPMITLGVNYQNFNDDSEAGLVWQAEVQPFDFLTVYGEYGNKTGTEDDQALVGAVAKHDSLGVRGEYNMETEDWAAKVGYNVTNNLLAEYQYNSNETSDFTVIYKF